jgi:hypothetical protein
MDTLPLILNIHTVSARKSSASPAVGRRNLSSSGEVILQTTYGLNQVMHRSCIARSLLAVARWAQRQPDVRAAAVVGSWARGTARRASDVDFVFVSARPKARRLSAQWAASLSTRAFGSALRRRVVRRYGVAWSLHAQLHAGRELELTFVPRSWAALHPVDAGTARVVKDGMLVLHDPTRSLTRLRRGIVHNSLLEPTSASCARVVGSALR